MRGGGGGGRGGGGDDKSSRLEEMGGEKVEKWKERDGEGSNLQGNPPVEQ